MRVAILHDVEALGPPADPVLDDVARALAGAGHEASRVAVGGDVAELVRDLRDAAPELVFNLSETFDGKSALDSGIASLLNLLDLRYTGSSHTGLTVAGDKALAKKILAFHGIRTPQFATLHRGALESAGDLAFPVIVKPPQEDASIGITTASVVRDLNGLLGKLDEIHREYHAPVLVEEFIDGRELYVGVLGNERAEALPPAELDMSGYPDDVPRVASWEAKWEEHGAEYRGSETVFPDDLEPELVEKARAVSLAAFHALRLRDYARIDLRVSPDGEPFVIEVNPNCYLREGEVFAESARRAGIDYAALIGRIVELAAGRYSR